MKMQEYRVRAGKCSRLAFQSYLVKDAQRERLNEMKLYMAIISEIVHNFLIILRDAYNILIPNCKMIV